MVVDILSLAAEHGAGAREFPLRAGGGLGCRGLTAGTPLGATTLCGLLKSTTNDEHGWWFWRANYITRQSDFFLI